MRMDRTAIATREKKNRFYSGEEDRENGERIMIEWRENYDNRLRLDRNAIAAREKRIYFTLAKNR